MSNTVEIIADEFAQNPRDWDNLGRMVCWHRRYNLGDAQPSVSPKEFVVPKGAVMLPLYLYDHSGITMKTTPFSCPWDSGQVGIIYTTLEAIRREFDVKRVTKKLRQKCEAILVSEVATYDAYISGDVYAIVEKDEDGEVVDSCGGYYGFDVAKEEAKRIQERLKSVV